MARLSTTPQRSYIMSRIRSRDTKPEMMLRKALWTKGIRYRIHTKGLPGSPDIVIRKYRLAIFVDGEFWHGKDWEQTRNRLRSNRDFWIAKIERNMERDRNNKAALKAIGYTVFRFWDDDIRKHLPQCVNQIQLYIETAREGRVPYPIDY